MKYIALPVSYLAHKLGDAVAQDGFYYRITERSPLRGPFDTRAGAIADAAWNINTDMTETGGSHDG